MEAFAFKIVLDVSSSLDRRIKADAQDAAAEEQEDSNPLDDGPTCAYSLNLCESYVSTFLTSHLLWLFIRTQIIRRNIADVLVVLALDLLDWSILS